MSGYRLNDPAYLQLLVRGNSNVADRSGHGAAPSVTGTTAYADGPFGKTVFNANAAGYIDTGSTFSTVLTGPFSIALWCTTADPTEAALRTLVGNEETLATTQGCIFRKDTGNADVYFTGHNGTAQQFSISTTVDGNVPNHFVAVYSGSAAFLYKNGEEVATDSSATGSLVGAGNVLFGRGTTVAARTWNGKLWDMRIYSVALQGAEAAALYRRQGR